MIIEDYVTYEQAIKLKELGFDWSCSHYYEKGIFTTAAEEIYIKSNQVYPLGETHIISIDSLSGNYNFLNSTYSAPTLSQVAKWLREKWNLYIDISPFSNSSIDSDRRNFWDFYIINVSTNSFIVGYAEDEFDTYEEALSAGINEVFELIKK